VLCHPNSSSFTPKPARAITEVREQKKATGAGPDLEGDYDCLRSGP
jgi:hypothetical protein